MADTLIIGYGNPLRGDDGLGWHAADRLTDILHETKARVIACHQLAPELAEPVSRAGLVIFIDAERLRPAGRLFRRRIRPAAAPPAAFSHHLTPAGLLGWAKAMYGSYPQAMVFSVSGESFSFGEKLSPAVSAVLRELTEQVCDLVRRREKRDTRKSKPAGVAE